MDKPVTQTHYGTAEDEAALERRRLDMLSAQLDPKTFNLLDRLGIGAGMHCLELGAGNGTVSAWMAERVGAQGRVMSTDIDLQFHHEMPDNVIVRQHDIEHDRPLPVGHFDLVHTRAVLQHLKTREEVLARLVQLLKPRGLLVVEDGNMREFVEQRLPEPYAAIHRLVAGANRDSWRDPDVGEKLLGWMRDLGLVDLDLRGSVWAMKPAEPSGEWWFLALERALPRLVDAGLVGPSDADQAMRQVRRPGFVMQSPTSLAVWGRRPPD